jgi:Leucine-rich repeat (LRR) protein
MKKTLLLIVTVLVTSLAAMADVTINSTYFPDAVFRNYLLSEYPSGTITTAQLNARDTLYLYNMGISNMKGVEYFTQLKYLMCHTNNLTSIDVSANTKLTYLNLGRNKLTSINVSENKSLQQLYLQNNSFSTSITVTDHNYLRTLWVNNNPNLKGFYCWRNALTNVDVTGCTSLESLKCYNNANLTSVTGLAGCTALTYLDCEDCSFSDLSVVNSLPNLEKLLARNNRLTTLDVHGKEELNALYVSGNSQLTTLACNDCHKLTTLQVSNCTALTSLDCFNDTQLAIITGLSTCTSLQQISCYSCNFSNLSDLNSLPNLTKVVCSNNKLTSLTLNNKSFLSQLWVDDNSQLTSLECTNNQLSNFNVTGCTQLLSLNCRDNSPLTEIMGLNNCTALTYLDCSNCSLSELTAVGDMSDLETLLVANNQLTSLTFGGLHGLKTLNAANNTQMTDLVCYSCALTSLDVTGCTSLDVLHCYYNYDLAAITGLETCTALGYLDCEDCSITSLPGLNNMPNLRKVWCRNNQLTQLMVDEKSQLKNLRVSGNPDLETLYCRYCDLESLDVTNCTGLRHFDCCENGNLTSIQGLETCTALNYFSAEYCALTSLDLNFCPDLESLYCYHNNLTWLNVSAQSNLKMLNCMQNENLTEITGLAYCTALTYLECSYCPLTNLDGVSGPMDDLQQLWCRGTDITALAVNNKPSLTLLVANDNQSLTDLECTNCALTHLNIDNCPALEYLDCEMNQLTEVSVTGCPALRYLILNSNKVTDLDLSNNPELALLWCNDNQLTSLDLSNCADDFYSLDCRYNQISGTLDVSRFTKLYQCVCNSNQISQLVLGDHSQLKDLWCPDNQLTSLDASGCPALETLYAYYNQLTSLSLNSPVLGRLYVYSNRLNSGAMGQIVESLPTCSDDNRGYMAVLVDEDPSGEIPEENVITAAQINQAIAKYWEVYHWVWDGTGWTPYTSSPSMRGDVDNSGNVSIDDVTALIDYLLGSNPDVNLQNADTDESGNISIDDVTALIDYLLTGHWPSRVTRASDGAVGKPSFVDDKSLVLEKPQRNRQ